MEKKNHSKDKILFSLYYFILLIYPYIFLINTIHPLMGFLDKNLYIILITVTLFFLFIFVFYRCHEFIDARWQVIVILLFPLLLFYLRFFVYEESIANLIAYQRSLTVFMVYWILGYFFVNFSAVEKSKISKLILINCIIQASIGICHHYLFPNLVLTPTVNAEGSPFLIQYDSLSRETGILFNASIYAYFVILGLFILVCRNPYSLTNSFRKFLYLMALLILIWGVLLSESRYPIFFSFLLLAYYAFKRATKYTNILLVIGSIVGFLELGKLFDHLINQRLLNQSGGSFFGGRDQTIFDSLQIITGHLMHFLMGTPMVILDDPSHVTGNNSYFAMILLYGMIGFIVWLFTSIVLLKKSIIISQSKLIMLFLIVALLLTNCVYWDIWLLYFFATLYCVQPAKKAIKKG